MESMTPVTPAPWRRWLWLLGALVAVGLGSAMALGWLPGGLGGAAGLGAALVAGGALGALWQRAGVFARPIIALQGASHELCLTFDDGPDPRVTPEILDLLARHRQRATFFVIGESARRHPQLVRRMVREGHEVANHTTDHPWHLALWPAARIEAELRRSAAQLEQISGQPCRCFRPPAGALSPAVARAAATTGQQLVGFSTRSGDGWAVVSARAALERLRRGLRPGAILLLHDRVHRGGRAVSPEVLSALLPLMEQAGLRSVTLSEALHG